MAKSPLSEQSIEQLEKNLSGAKTVQNTVIGIFAVIILAWIVLGYWRDNLPVFISTLAMAAALMVTLTASRRGVVEELKRRRTG